MARVLNNTSHGQLLFADHATDFGAAPATAGNSLIIGTPTDVQIDVSSLTADSARASAKFDLGGNRPPLYRLDACMEGGTAPSDGESYEFWIAESPSTTAGTGNPAGLTGVDEAVTYTRGLVGQAKYIGSMLCRNVAINISTNIGEFRPTHRYGMLIIVNRASTMAATVDEVHVTLTPIEYDQV